MSKDFYTGYGWYRRHLEMDRSDLKGLVFLEFDGVFQEAEIFVNGKKREITSEDIRAFKLRLRLICSVEITS